MQFWAKDPGMLCRMTWADETAGVSPLSAHLVWPSAEDEEAERSEEGAPAVRHFFLGQLPDDQSDGVWEDDRPDDPPDDAPDFEGFELPACTASADVDHALHEDALHLDLVATVDTELPDPASPHADDHEQPLTSAADDPTAVATRPVPLAGGRETDGVAPERHARGPRSRIAIVAAAVIALIVGTAVYLGTRAKAEDQGGRRPSSTSLERQSASTTGTTVTTASSDPAPDTEPAPAWNTAPGSAAPASRQGAPKATGSTQTGAPATRTAGAGSPPPAASSGPNASPPPPPTPAPSTSPNPVCQVTPQLCP